jgi:PadR family transcriptional regulator PadR
MECNDETECINETGSRYEKGGRHMTTISSDVIRGYNDTIILYLLLDRPSYGYEISRMIRTISDGKYVIKETTLYSAFTRMEKNGYITSFFQNAENGKRRTYYSITDAGREYYREKCAEWNLTKEVIERFISPAGVRALPGRQ